jgi:NAD-dependent deacetylase
MNTDNWIGAVLALRHAKRTVVFSGAGMSVESGVPTFRDTGGFWQRFPPEQFANWKGLLKTAMSHPRLLAEFVWNMIEPIARAKPNAGHLAVAELEKRVEIVVVTQNIDGLHQAAGSGTVHEIHGSLLEVVDSSTGKIVHRFERGDLAHIAATVRRYVDAESSILSLANELCRQYPFDWLGHHRPNVVLFGDSLAQPAWSEGCYAAETCDVLISVGTSGTVYPAAMIPYRAEALGATVISIDPSPSPGFWLQGKSSDVLPELIQAAFGSTA